MEIIISLEQVMLINSLIEPINVAHIDAGCEPPGFTISISFLGPYGNHAVGQCGPQSVDLGEVTVRSMQSIWPVSNDGK